MQDKITIKIVGKTVMTTLEGDAKRANLEKEQKDSLKELIEKYNKKPSQALLTKIKKFFVSKEVPKAKVEAKKVKAKEKVDKKEEMNKAKLTLLESQLKELLESGKQDKKTIYELKKKLEKYEEKKVQEVKPQEAPRRSGEH